MQKHKIFLLTLFVCIYLFLYVSLCANIDKIFSNPSNHSKFPFIITKVVHFLKTPNLPYFPIWLYSKNNLLGNYKGELTAKALYARN